MKIAFKNKKYIAYSIFDPKNKKLLKDAPSSILAEKGEVYRIMAATDIPNAARYVSKGEWGGFISSKRNLSTSGNCWIADEAMVLDKAEVVSNALVTEKAHVLNSALISGTAIVCGEATVSGNAVVFGEAFVGDMASVSGSSAIRGKVTGAAQVRDMVNIYSDALIGDKAVVGGNALVYGIVMGFGVVNGSATVALKGIVSESQYVTSGIVYTDLSTDIEESLRCQLGVIPIDGKIRVYKEVTSDFTSIYDPTFKYPEKGVVFPRYYNTDPSAGCGSGLHFSTPTYWNSQVEGIDTITLIADVDIDDIIAVQAGNIRCREATIIGSYYNKHKKPLPEIDIT